MITLKKIAEKCNVSIATVSNILNGKGNVSDETKERILKVIKETGYKPNYLARHLRATKTQSIGIIIDDLMEFSSSGIIDGIMSYLEKHHYKSILENLRFYSKWGTKWYSNESYEKSVDAAIRELSAIKVDGIIYVAGHARNISCLPENPEIPIVVSYAFTNNKNISTVEIDDITSAYNLATHLIKNGHKKINCIAGKKDNIHTTRRLEGLKKALSENGITLNEEQIYYGNWKNDSGFEGCKHFQQSKDDFTAIFCFNDIMAAGVYDFMNSSENSSYNIEDISIVGFDNRTVSQFLKPSLTTMEIPLFDIGEKSAELILQQINAKEPFKKQESFVSCKLIERKSVHQL